MITDKKNHEIDKLLLELEVLEPKLYSRRGSPQRDAKLLILYDKILSLNPELVDIELRKLGFLFNRGRYNEANRFVDELLKKYPNNIDLLADKVDICLDLGDKKYQCGPFFFKIFPDRKKYYNDALDAIEKLLKLDQNFLLSRGSEANGWYWKGVCLDNLDRYSEALEAYEKSYPLDSCVISLMGDLFFKMGKYVEALEKYQITLTLKEGYRGNHYWPQDSLPKMGYCYLMIGEYQNALYIFKEYENLPDERIESTMRMDASDPQRLKKEFLKEKSIALIKECEINEAKTSLEEYFELFPADPQAYFIMSILLQKINDNKTALWYLDLALKIDPNFADGWLEKSKIHHKLGNYEEEKISSDHVLLIYEADDEGKCNHDWWNLLYNCFRND
jgi:tetratricopeptide (TPR) repeat protein